MLAARKYQVCTRCIMDTSDPEIVFDDNGVCNHCWHFENNSKGRILKGDDATQKLDALVSKIKAAGKNREYDCIVGVSGGVDSTYTAYLTKKLGLRPLAVHFDNGWNSELAVSNIEKVLNLLKIDLYTYVVDWEEFKDIQLSFLKASTPDSEIPSDHAIFGALMRVASEKNVRYIICGTNFTTEGIYIESWGYGHNDWYYIKNLHKKYGSVPIKTFPYYSIFHLFYYLVIKRMKFVSILNYINYDKKEAIKTLEKELGWRYYGGKHHESIYTRFFQSYILPKKFGIDKRRSHLSAILYSSDGKFTRPMALQELSSEICPQKLIDEDREFTIKKLGLTEDEFDKMMALPVKSFRDYKSRYGIIMRLKRLQNWLRKVGILHK